MPSVQSIRLINGRTRTAQAKKRANPASLVILGNGGSRTMPANRKRKRNKNKNAAWRKNPFFGFGKKRRKARRSHSRRRRNPANRRHRNPDVTSIKQTGIISAAAIAGGMGARIIPQSVLPNQNAGYIGYAMNLAVAFGGGWLIERFAKMPTVALGWKVGGIVMTAGRFISDKFGKTVVTFSSGMSGLGYRGDAAFDLRGMGALYAKSRTPLPTSSTIQNGLMIVNGQGRAVPVAALPVATGVQVAKTATAAAAGAPVAAAPATGLSYNPNWRAARTRGRFAA
jgi:hypothetical protein